MALFLFNWTLDNELEFQNKITSDIATGLITDERADILKQSHGLLKMAYLNGLSANNIIILASDITWTPDDEAAFQNRIRLDLVNANNTQNHNMVSSLNQLGNANNIVKYFYFNNIYPLYVINRLLTTPAGSTYLFLIGQDQARAFNCLYLQYTNDNTETKDTGFDINDAFNQALKITNNYQSSAFATGLVTVDQAVALCPDSTELSQAKVKALKIPGVAFEDLDKFTNLSQADMLEWIYNNNASGYTNVDSNNIDFACQFTSKHNIDAFLTLVQLHRFLQIEDQYGNFTPVYPEINTATTDSNGNNLISIISNDALEYDYPEQVITLNTVFNNIINKINSLNPDELESQIASLRAQIEPGSALIEQINSMTPSNPDIVGAISSAIRSYQQAVINAQISGSPIGISAGVTTNQIYNTISGQVYSGFMGLVNKYLSVGYDFTTALTNVNALVTQGFSGRLYTILDIIRYNDSSVASLTDAQRLQYLMSLSTTILQKAKIGALNLSTQNYWNVGINSYISDAKSILASLIAEQQESGASANIVNAITQVNSLIFGLDNILKIAEINAMLSKNICFSNVSTLVNNESYDTLRSINDLLDSGVSFNDVLSSLNIDTSSIVLAGENNSS